MIGVHARVNLLIFHYVLVGGLSAVFQLLDLHSLGLSHHLSKLYRRGAASSRTVSHVFITPLSWHAAPATSMISATIKFAIATGRLEDRSDENDEVEDTEEEDEGVDEEDLT